MAKIQIKRGLQSAVTNLVLAEGELAVALDTGNVYIGTTTGTVHVNPSGGVADEATKLKNSRAFSITGDGTAPSVSFNGEADVALALTLSTMPGLTAGTYTKLTVDTKGRVTGASQLEFSDLPGLGTAAALNTGTSSGNVVVVGADGKISASIIPSLAIMDVHTASSEAEMLALTCQKGDICVRSDMPATFILTNEPASTLSNWVQMLTPTCDVQSVNGKTGVVVIETADVHATYGATTSGMYKITTDAYGHISARTAVSKADITGLGIPAQDTTYEPATTSTNGLMTSSDKTKLNGIATNANNYVLPKATASTLGGVMAGNGLTVSNGVLSVGDVDGGTF